MRIGLRDEQLQIGGDMIRAQAEVLGQVQVQVTGWDPEHPLNQASLPPHLSRGEILILASPALQLSPKGRYHSSSPPPLYLLVSISPTDPPPRNDHACSARLCRSSGVKGGCERRYRAWRSWERGYGRENVWEEPQERAGQTSRQTDERSERKKKGAKVEETAKEDRVEEPIKTNCS